jgi:hypothetical protein
LREVLRAKEDNGADHIVQPEIGFKAQQSIILKTAFVEPKNFFNFNTCRHEGDPSSQRYGVLRVGALRLERFVAGTFSGIMKCWSDGVSSLSVPSGEIWIRRTVIYLQK